MFGLKFHELWQKASLTLVYGKRQLAHTDLQNFNCIFYEITPYSDSSRDNRRHSKSAWGRPGSDRRSIRWMDGFVASGDDEFTRGRERNALYETTV